MKLAAVVFVSGPDGETHRFGPDSELPDWVADAVTNPKAWAEAPAQEAEPEPPSAPKPTKARSRS